MEKELTDLSTQMAKSGKFDFKAIQDFQAKQQAKTQELQKSLGLLSAHAGQPHQAARALVEVGVKLREQGRALLGQNKPEEAALKFSSAEDHYFGQALRLMYPK